MTRRRKFKSVWPLPVYVATFADGEVGRFSFGTPPGKPINFARGRGMVCHAWRIGAFPHHYRRVGRKCPDCRGTGERVTTWGPAYSDPKANRSVRRCLSCEKGKVFRSWPFNRDGTQWTIEQYWTAPERVDIVAGHVEIGAEVFRDPMFGVSP